ncbi:MAG: hypothetical protein QMD36_03715 [Candidatus Aenigmarchaeota archaeon]|nr:hypothetical protein [Candidatus Aenigmarchaeota archaeon]
MREGIGKIGMHQFSKLTNVPETTVKVWLRGCSSILYESCD